MELKDTEGGDMKRYYSEEFRQELLELSDERVLWTIYLDDQNEGLYNELVRKEQDDFRSQFKIEVYLCGRNGRHVCVEDTEENRERYNEMEDWVEKSISRIKAEFLTRH